MSEKIYVDEKTFKKLQPTYDKVSGERVLAGLQHILQEGLQPAFSVLDYRIASQFPHAYALLQIMYYISSHSWAVSLEDLRQKVFKWDRETFYSAIAVLKNIGYLHLKAVDDDDDTMIVDVDELAGSLPSYFEEIEYVLETDPSQTLKGYKINIG